MRAIEWHEVAISTACIDRWHRATTDALAKFVFAGVDVAKGVEGLFLLDDGRLRMTIEIGSEFSIVNHAAPGEWRWKTEN